ncbi:MAG: hypothetical protein U9N49_04185 [Campylobacterota bacterium]|nr:hypothetical protein [Campylobacterota bacterium]
MIHQIGLVTIYLLVAYIVALMGRNRKFGFWGYLFLSILATPIVGLLTVLASYPKSKLKEIEKKKK